MFDNFYQNFIKSRTQSALYRLNDAKLADIGIKRSQIREYVENLYA